MPTSSQPHQQLEEVVGDDQVQHGAGEERERAKKKVYRRSPCI